MDLNEVDHYLEQVSRGKISRREFLTILMTAGATSFLAACAPSPAPTSAPAPTTASSGAATAAPPTSGPSATTAATTPKRGGTLIMAAESMGDSLEPGLWNGFGASNVIDQVCDHLTRPSDASWTDPPRPALAESWDISPDGKTYVFHIRNGVKFHDGADLDAKAVVRSLSRMTDTTDKSYVKGLYMNAEYGIANFDSISATDNMTVKLVLKSADNAQLYRLFHPASAIISPKALDQYGPNIGTNLVGAGPFKLDKFVPGQEANLVAFSDYWDKPRPYLDKVVIRGYPDDASMLAAIDAAEVNLAPYPPASGVKRLMDSGKWNVQMGPPLINLFLGCCMLNPPMDNVNIRLAINYAINRQNLIDGVLYGQGQLPASFVGPTEFGFDSSGREISKQDVAKAKDLIAKSGLPTPISFNFSYENDRFWPQMAELVKSDLDAVGFQVTLDKLDYNSYWAKDLGGKTQLNMNQRSLWVPDPDNKVRLLHSSQQEAQDETGVAKTPLGKQLDELIDAGRSETDKNKRLQIYKQLQDLLLQQMPYVMLAYYTKPVVMAKNLKDLPIGGASTERVFLHTVWLA